MDYKSKLVTPLSVAISVITIAISVITIAIIDLLRAQV